MVSAAEVAPDRRCSACWQRTRGASGRFAALPAGAGGSAAGPAPLPRVGPWELLRKLGQGTFGAVFEARRVGEERRAALKLLLAGEAQDEARFAREVALMRQVDHPGVVRVLDAGRLGSQPWYVMELCEGETLKERLRRGPFAPDEAARLVRELALALGAVHARGIVHRDLKPSNVILERASGQPRVTDFGLGRAVEATGRLTRTGDQLGTPLYMAPELFLDAKRAGPPADVWSLGAILYECLTGRTPFLGERVLDIARCAQASEPAPPRLLRPQVPPALENACLRALARDPAARPDALGLAAALQVILATELGGPGSPGGGPTGRGAAHGPFERARLPGTERWPQAAQAAPYLAAHARAGLSRPRPRQWRTLLAAAGLVGTGALAGLLIAWAGAAPEPLASSPAGAPPAGGAAPEPSQAAPPPPAGPAIQATEPTGPAPLAPPAAAPEQRPAEPVPGSDPLRAAQEELALTREPAARARAARRVIGLLHGRGRASEARQVALELSRVPGPFAGEAALRAAFLAVHFGAGSREEGVEELRRLAGDPAAGPAAVVAGTLLQAGPGRPLAVEPLARALESEPDLGPARRLLAAALFPSDAQRAVALLEEGLQRVPEDAALAWQLIGLHQQRRELDQADRLLERLIAQGGAEADFEALYQRARDELNRSRHAAAIPWLDRALQREPANLIALLMRGVCRWTLGQPEPAVQDWRQAALQHGLGPFQRELERRYHDPRLLGEVWSGLVGSLALTLPPPPGPGREGCLAADAATAPPAARGPLLEALRAAAEGAPWERLAPAWEAARIAAPESAALALLEARALLGRERLEAAAQALERARGLDPTAAEALWLLELEAEQAERVGDAELARGRWQELQRRDPRGPYGLRAAVAQVPEGPPRAEAVRAALARAPDDAGLLALAADALAPADPLLALAAAERVLATRGAQDVRLLLARARALGALALHCGQPQALLAQVERVLEVAPQAARGWGLLGLARLRAGRPAGEVVDAWRRARELAPREPLPGAWLEELRARHGAGADEGLAGR